MASSYGVQNSLQTRTTPPPPIDITAFFPELAPLARRTVRLHPRRGPEPGPGESKVGGTFLWPSDEPWPTCPVGHVHSEPQRSQDAEMLSEEADTWSSLNASIRESYRNGLLPRGLAYGSYGGIIQRNGCLERELDPMPEGQPHGAYIGVIQLRAADVPELGFPEGCDLFQLLWCPRDHSHFPKDCFAIDQWGPACRVYWRDSKAISTPLKENPIPAVFFPGYLPYICQLAPERIHDYPPFSRLPRELQERVRSWEMTEAAQGYDYMTHLSVTMGMKIGGHTSWIDRASIPFCAFCQQEMEHLLTIGVDEWDYGKARWRPVEDQHLVVEGLLPNDRDVLNPAGIGNGSGMHMFVCHRCPGWPTAYTQLDG
jgi:hypothetical protein